MFPKEEPSLPPPDLFVCKKACEVLYRHASVAFRSINWIRSSATMDALRPQQHTMSDVHAVFVGVQGKARENQRGRRR